MSKRKIAGLYSPYGENRSINFSNVDITNDFMFSSVMANQSLCIGLLECLLDVKINRIEYVMPQEEEGETIIEEKKIVQGVETNLIWIIVRTI